MTRVDFIFFDAGGGHRSAAVALQAVIERQRRPWTVRLVNLQEILDPLDIARKLIGIRSQDLYNWSLKKGLTLGSPQTKVAMQALFRFYHAKQVKLLKQFWSASPPDMVVSLVPNFNRSLFQGLRAASPGAPFVTILTDFADYPPHFWMERQEQYFVCGTCKAMEQALAMGHAPERLFRASGMILRPSFYERGEGCRERELEALGLRPGLPTGLVLFGAEGSNAMARICRAVGKAERELQLILICGHNGKLRKRLEAMPARFPRLVEGFTNRVPNYMELADFFIGKPGPGRLSEALAMGLPVIMERNAWTLPQERYNTDWVRERGVGVVLDSFRRIESGLDELLEAENFARFRANAAAIRNRAVFEIPEFLASVLAKRPS